MPESNILQRLIAVQMLIAFFEINIIFWTVCNRLVDHILLDFIIYPPASIHLEVCVDIILYWDAEQIANGLHRRVRSINNGCVNTLLAVIWNWNVRISKNGEYADLLLYGIKRGDEHRIGTRDFPFLHTAGIHTHEQNIYRLCSFPFRRLRRIHINRFCILKWRFVCIRHAVKLSVNGSKVVDGPTDNKEENNGQYPKQRFLFWLTSLCVPFLSRWHFLFFLSHSHCLHYNFFWGYTQFRNNPPDQEGVSITWIH